MIAVLTPEKTWKILLESCKRKTNDILQSKTESFFRMAEE